MRLRSRPCGVRLGIWLSRSKRLPRRERRVARRYRQWTVIRGLFGRERLGDGRHLWLLVPREKTLISRKARRGRRLLRRRDAGVGGEERCRVRLRIHDRSWIGIMGWRRRIREGACWYEIGRLVCGRDWRYRGYLTRISVIGAGSAGVRKSHHARERLDAGVGHSLLRFGHKGSVERYR